LNFFCGSYCRLPSSTRHGAGQEVASASVFDDIIDKGQPPVLWSWRWQLPGYFVREILLIWVDRGGGGGHTPNPCPRTSDPSPNLSLPDPGLAGLSERIPRDATINKCSAGSLRCSTRPPLPHPAYGHPLRLSLASGARGLIGPGQPLLPSWLGEGSPATLRSATPSGWRGTCQVSGLVSPPWTA